MLTKSLRFVRLTITKISLVVFITLLSLLGGIWFASAEASTTLSSQKCPALVPDKIYRFIEGLDTCITPLSNSDIEKLNDPFAKSLLRQGSLPATTEDLNQVIADKFGYKRTIYFVGEGSQIPTTVAARNERRSLRYNINWGPNENDSKIMLSIPAPGTNQTQSLIEVVSFDDQSKEYNYYVHRPQVGESEESPFLWAWAGKTSQAQQPQTIGQGCFSCHHNGVPVMREIELPWNNWQSQRANISATFLPEEVATENFFLQRHGAEVFEQVIRSTFQNYYKNWLKERIRKEGSIAYVNDVDKMLRHLTTTTTVNFKSSDVQSDGHNTSPENSPIAGIPPNDTFLADTLLQTTLKLDYSPLSVTLPRDKYDEYLKKHDFKLVGTKRFARTSETAYEAPGETYFAYYVPQVAAEDIYVTQKLLQSKIVTDKFVAALLMVDYKNPLFSSKRASLQKYAKEITNGKIIDGVSSVPTDFAAKIKETGAKPSNAENFDASSAESQFLYTWELPDDQWKQVSANHLQAYVDSVENLEPDERLDRLMEWSIKQRDRFATTPPFCNYFESRLLLPESDLSKKLPNCPPITASN
ncbi:hypothetical protein [Brasilonema sp. UFV-L1]|uniref:hypothetical protein n=1 Tax=Brasilonema sp. UFV-L1 TaxID=2234130 RepID=UPI00145E0ABD|nr:hypothetical protein [Brasilonema sp. UFV-L1]NMG09979.1 hypothetical protein [Brasilonema sp. UFV-L1]